MCGWCGIKKAHVSMAVNSSGRDLVLLVLLRPPNVLTQEHFEILLLTFLNKGKANFYPACFACNQSCSFFQGDSSCLNCLKGKFSHYCSKTRERNVGITFLINMCNSLMHKKEGRCPFSQIKKARAAQTSLILNDAPRDAN